MEAELVKHCLQGRGMGFFVRIAVSGIMGIFFTYRLKYQMPYMHDESGFVAFAVGARESGHWDTVLLVA